MRRFLTYLELVRFPNLFTAMADILAGAWVVLKGWDQVWPAQVLLLMTASTCLYAMGILLNDYFDYEIDKRERPERPLPSGRVSRSTTLGLCILSALFGIGISYFVTFVSFLIACAIAVAVLLYDRYTKHHDFLGPLNMGICRGLNLLLGMSVLSSPFIQFWWLSGIGVLYIFTVTIMSKGETGNGYYPNRVRAIIGSILLCAALILVAGLLFAKTLTTVLTAIFVFLLWTFSGVLPALFHPTAGYLRKAVRICIVGIPLLDAAIATPFGGWPAFLSVAFFFVISQVFSQTFSVT